jgi:hypothetical protein
MRRCPCHEKVPLLSAFTEDGCEPVSELSALPRAYTYREHFTKKNYKWMPAC